MAFYDSYDAMLSREEQDLVAVAGDFCEGEFSAHLLASHNKGQPYDAAWIHKWALAGFLGLQAPRELGGHDASFLCKIRVAQTMAEHGFAAAFAINNLQGAVTRVARSGSDPQRDALLQGMLSGDILCAPAMSEPGGGSDLGALTTSARRVDGGWLISGTKSWITNGQIIRCANVLSRVAGGGVGGQDIASFLVPLEDKATFRREEIHMPGARSFRLSHLIFQDHFVPEWSLFNQPGQALKAAMASVNAARVHVAAMCVASTRAALREAVDHAQSRHAFGKPLIRHQGMAWELAEVSLRLEAANALVWRAATAVQAGAPALTLAAQAKKFAVDVALWGIDQCLRAMGATGASAAHRLAMQSAETRLAAFGDGTSEMLLERIGKELAKEYGMAPIQQGKAPA
ncbi:Acyl-CoA dehydrogenase, short-chain specific [Variovorax sp. PBL-H6]|uniref:acyl-CoA dehydrogenase family protein n=1 Tax=Variovorax sp. PBL-H6 TaxID=434009 RepID=UPI0013182F30|nr:acyl-CoA dehydrogenase family protein [Variovorax sp. PBL-H6]VTU21774.1 Acyl-CoA dehydrogenase, short-chain specific [Variovorax sp. PBL-H6]